MKIALDYTAAARQRAGIGRYTRSLIRALAQQDLENQYALYVPHNALYLDDTRAFPKNFRVTRAPFNERYMVAMWQRARVPLPIEMLTGAANVFYSPDFVLPPTRAKRKILTIHDLSFKRHPETAVPNLKWYLDDAVPRAIQRADLILADSNSTRSDLQEFFNTPPERIQTLYSGYDDFFQRVTDAAELQKIRDRYELRKPFILNVGTIEPRKNLVRLIEAFSKLKQRREMELVIAGGRGWMYDEIYEAPEKFGVSAQVRFIGYTPDEDLPALYSMAELFVYPSLYEGFGLPVLEALACGAAVVTSNNSSMPEVAGDAALLVEARDVNALVWAMERLLNDATWRAIKQKTALKQAAKFSWATSATQLRRVLTA